MSEDKAMKIGMISGFLFGILIVLLPSGLIVSYNYRAQLSHELWGFNTSNLAAISGSFMIFPLVFALLGTVIGFLVAKFSSHKNL